MATMTKTDYKIKDITLAEFGRKENHYRWKKRCLD